MNNYHNIFTYNSIEYTDKTNGRQNTTYVDCVMLKDCEELKKGTKVPYISVSYELYCFDEKDEMIHDVVTVDTTTAP